VVGDLRWQHADRCADHRGGVGICKSRFGLAPGGLACLTVAVVAAYAVRHERGRDGILLTRRRRAAELAEARQTMPLSLRQVEGSWHGSLIAV
jgi:hypothetical protein